MYLIATVIFEFTRNAVQGLTQSPLGTEQTDRLPRLIWKADQQSQEQPWTGGAAGLPQQGLQPCPGETAGDREGTHGGGTLAGKAKGSHRRTSFPIKIYKHILNQDMEDEGILGFIQDLE